MSRSAQSSPWVLRPKPSPGSTLRLFCFPYAGGGASSFWSWKEELPPDVELCAIQIPGREARVKEPPIADLGALIEPLAAALLPELDRPFALFGHSVGALIAFELARHLRRRAWPSPRRLFVAARPAPQLPRRGPRLTRLADRELVAVLRRAGAIPEEIAQNERFLAMILPAVRADLTISEDYAYRAEQPFTFPISAFGGLSDASVGRAELLPWQSHTSAGFKVWMLPGDHFVAERSRAALVRQLLQDLRYQMN